MADKKGSSTAKFVANYFKEQDNASSDEEHGKVESFEFADFEPFMASFRRYRMELSETEKQAQMFKGLSNIRANTHMANMIEKMFDYDLEVSDLERDLLSVKEKMEPIFNFIDLSFQRFDDPFDDNAATLLKKLNELRRYYDRKSTLNVHHSETIIDIFRFCVRKDRVLSKALDGDFTGFDFDFETKQTPEMDATINIGPQPKSMEVELQLFCK